MSDFEKSFRKALAAASSSGKPAWWTSQHDQAYSALQKAGERIGASEHAAGRYKVKRGRTGKVVSGYSVSAEHKQIVDAMADLGRNRITPEAAMAILHEYDVMKARTSSPRAPSGYALTNDLSSAWGTGLVGHTRPAQYAQMVMGLGRPLLRSAEDDKINFMWIFARGGKVFTVYDYKFPKMSTAEFKTKTWAWNVGSNASEAASAEFIKWANTKISLA